MLSLRSVHRRQVLPAVTFIVVAGLVKKCTISVVTWLISQKG